MKKDGRSKRCKNGGDFKMKFFENILHFFKNHFMSAIHRPERSGVDKRKCTASKLLQLKMYFVVLELCFHLKCHSFNIFNIITAIMSFSYFYLLCAIFILVLPMQAYVNALIPVDDCGCGIVIVGVSRPGKVFN